MEDLYTIKYRLYSTESREGIFVFLANSKYQDGDLRKNLNCSECLSWVASLENLNEFINQAGNNKELVSRFIFKMIRIRSEAKIERLYHLYTGENVELMLEVLELFIKLTVVEDYFKAEI
ncbi:hypothetical protein [Pedobacter sp. L105]|uniref:hypothetical protein n=1 Tax=Pedobacter sp. L105 TaxID=1641871 RepID=UPI00131C5FB8|nr:hypothetical protein [Pedobacter sp. L105]